MAVDRELANYENCHRGMRQPDAMNEAKGNYRKGHFPTLMAFCHLKHTELAEHVQTYKWQSGTARRQRQRRGGYAAFTEQGASASQMTAA